MQSIRSIEGPELCQLLLLLREDLDDEDIPKRDKIHNAIIVAWKAYYISLKQDLKVSVISVCVCITDVSAKAAIGKISYTTDIWFSADKTPYMAVTAHWMAKTNGQIELKAALIAFQRVWGKHTAKNLASILLHILDCAGTTNNVSY